MVAGQDTGVKILQISYQYRGAEKPLARPGRNQAASVENVMDRGMD